MTRTIATSPSRSVGWSQLQRAPVHKPSQRSGLLFRNSRSIGPLLLHAQHAKRVQGTRRALLQDGKHIAARSCQRVSQTCAEVGAISRRFGACPSLQGRPSRSYEQRRHPLAASLVQGESSLSRLLKLQIVERARARARGHSNVAAVASLVLTRRGGLCTAQ